LGGIVKSLAGPADLLDLQALDLRIDALLDQRASLPELERFRAVHESLTATTKRADDLADSIRTANRELDKIEGEVGIARAKLEQVQVKMYSGGANAKEAQHLGMEVEQIKRQISEMEDRELEIMETLEELEPQLATEQAEQARLDAEKAELEAVIKDAWATIDAELARKEARKAEEAKGIEPSLLATYEKIREIREGRAVGPLEDGNVCGSCNVTLSAAEIHALRSEDLPRCVHCGRLLAL
jgi:predicted  nucleic acid-binding Zn-ribbon protein